MRQHSGTSVSELKRKYNHLVPSNERVLGLVETDKNMSLSEVRGGQRDGGREKEREGYSRGGEASMEGGKKFSITAFILP